MTRNVTALMAVVALACGAATAAQSGSQQPPAPAGGAATPAMADMHEHEHGAPVPAMTYAELQRTAEQLAAARQATAKYQDVHVAEAAGYRAIGPDVPGMGIHYVNRAENRQFSIEKPSILLYERDETTPAGLRLVGVSYLFTAAADADGQPVNPPFPKSLATWHKHSNICVLADNSATSELTEPQCGARGGRFTAETNWMVHAWIWKESPTGVFSPTNPLVK